MFKRILFTFFVLLHGIFAIGQNLVPNPSFEDTVYCPFGTNQMDACANWKSYGNSPDYFNACNQFGMSVPNSVFGYQYAHSGNAIAGIGLYRRPNSPNGPNYREFIGAQLVQTLQIGVNYYLSFYINFSYNTNIALACNKAGIRFSTLPFDSCCQPPISNWAHLYTDSIYTDSIAWYKVEGSFIADSAYNYICLSNFFDDLNTDTVRLSLAPDYSYYYFDDICVTTDSIYNQTWTGIKQLKDHSIQIYPNPAENALYLSNLKDVCEYAILDNLGRIILGGTVHKDNTTIDISKLAPGMYYLRLKKQTSVSTNPFLKQHQP